MLSAADRTQPRHLEIANSRARVLRIVSQRIVRVLLVWQPPLVAKTLSQEAKMKTETETTLNITESEPAHASQMKKGKFAPHIQALLYGPDDILCRTLPYMGLTAESFVTGNSLKKAFIDKSEQQTHTPKKFNYVVDNMIRSKKKTKREDRGSIDGSIHKYQRFDEIIEGNKFGKIQFREVGAKCEVIPKWVLTRLETACRSFRYELPFNKRLLEHMTPLQYLATYTRLNKEQRRRYTEIFKKYKVKPNDYLELKSLHPALNSLLGGYFSEDNYDILSTCLFIPEDVNLDCNTFVGICAFVDRLFWTAYLEYEDDTFSFWAPNRSALEYADFENLRRKLSDVQLSKELTVLLQSLA
uniref:Uncharacterized protein n=2 Tax=Biomphalaria glabrata TaxID=6526 RepID=A0A2C9L3F9_BIOGL